MNSRKPTVSVEDLLRVKRAEQPPVEFWAEFDRDLRAKQLAAIVEPRPWWAPLIKLGSRVSHLQVPIGATAVLALTFITIREYQAPVVSADYVTPRVAQTAPAFPTVEQAVLTSQVTPTSVAANELSSETEYASLETATVQEPIATVTNTIASVQEVALEPREPSPSERYIAANLAAAQAADPRLINDVFGVSMRQSEAAQPIRDPLAQVSAAESRRARLLATSLPVNGSNNDSVTAPSDRVARHLTEERLYDTITRVGLKGDRVAIKF